MNQKAYDKAIQLLNMRMHASGELAQKLKTKGFADSDIREVIKKLEDLRFLDDEHFARIFVENMKAYKDWGYFGLKAKLIKKYLPSDIIERTLERFYPPEVELAVAERLVKKLKNRGRGRYQKLARSLASKGFRNEIIGKVLD